PDLLDGVDQNSPVYTGQSDPDLHELHLHYPEGGKFHANITLGSSSGVHFWLYPNHTGFLGHSKTWVIGEDSLPRNGIVYVEATDGSLLERDVLITLADDERGAGDPPDHPTNLQTPTSAPASQPYRATE